MSTKASVALCAFLALVSTVCLTTIYQLTRSSAPTPTHQANVFFDGVNHGDYRQTCRTWQAGRKHQPECVAYLASMTAMNGQGDYHVLPHSYRGWREGTTEVASVRVFNAASGATLVARLVKTRAHGWLVVSVQ